jgi:hypothetical protein
VSRLDEDLECALADLCIVSMAYRQSTERLSPQPSHVVSAIGLIGRQGAARLEQVIGGDKGRKRRMLGFEKGAHASLRANQHGLHRPERIVEIEADGEGEIGHSESARPLVYNGAPFFTGP